MDYTKIPNGQSVFIRKITDENAALRTELSRLKRDQEELSLGAGPHNDPKDCPTFYDHCHCTVENLLHNIERAEKAEDELAQLRARVEELVAERERLRGIIKSLVTENDLGMPYAQNPPNWDWQCVYCESEWFNAGSEHHRDECPVVLARAALEGE